MVYPSPEFFSIPFFRGDIIRVSAILKFLGIGCPLYKKCSHLDKVLNTGSRQDFDCCSTCELNKFEFKGFQDDPFCCCCCEVEKLSNMGSCFNGLFEPWILSSEWPPLHRPLPMAALLAFCCLSCSLAASSKLWIKWHLGP
jgi:hypothetical protein